MKHVLTIIFFLVTFNSFGQGSQIEKQISQQGKPNLTNSFDSIIDLMNKENQIQAFNNRSGIIYFKARFIRFSESIRKDLDNIYDKYPANSNNDSIQLQHLFYTAQLSYNREITLNGLKRYRMFKGYFPYMNYDFEDYSYINIPRELPDLFFIPTCNCFTSNSTVRNYTKYDSAFLYLRNAEKCRKIKIKGNLYSIRVKKSNTDSVNEEKALFMLRNIILNTEPPKDNYANIDLVKYSNAFVWYGYLQNKYAKTIDDLKNGYDLIRKWKYYDGCQKSVLSVNDGYNKDDKANNIYESNCISCFNSFINYFAFLFSYRITLENKPK